MKNQSYTGRGGNQNAKGQGKTYYYSNSSDPASGSSVSSMIGSRRPKEPTVNVEQALENLRLQNQQDKGKNEIKGIPEEKKEEKKDDKVNWGDIIYEKADDPESSVQDEPKENKDEKIDKESEISNPSQAYDQKNRGGYRGRRNYRGRVYNNSNRYQYNRPFNQQPQQDIPRVQRTRFSPTFGDNTQLHSKILPEWKPILKPIFCIKHVQSEAKLDQKISETFENVKEAKIIEHKVDQSLEAMLAALKVSSFKVRHYSVPEIIERLSYVSSLVPKEISGSDALLKQLCTLCGMPYVTEFQFRKRTFEINDKGGAVSPALLSKMRNTFESSFDPVFVIESSDDDQLIAHYLHLVLSRICRVCYTDIEAKWVIIAEEKLKALRCPESE